MSEDTRERLKDIIHSEAVMRGEFVLASGKTSTVYLDCRRASLHPEGAVLAATALLERIDELGLEPDCVGGPTMGADPLIGAMVPISHQLGRPLPGFLVRKAPCPVWVARKGPHEGLENIVAPVDFGTLAPEILKLTHSIAQDVGAMVHVLHVIDFGAESLLRASDVPEATIALYREQRGDEAKRRFEELVRTTLGDADDGIDLKANGTQLLGNKCFKNGDDGIDLNNANGCLVDDNTATGNAEYGFNVDGTGNQIQFNRAKGNALFDLLDGGEPGDNTYTKNKFGKVDPSSMQPS